jgi:hypothetical protein
MPLKVTILTAVPTNARIKLYNELVNGSTATVPEENAIFILIIITSLSEEGKSYIYD